MSKGWKIALSIAAAVLLLMMLGVGGCIYYFSQLGKDVEQDKVAGERLGETADEDACLKEALARTKGKNMITGTAALIGQLIEEGTLTEEQAEKLGGKNIILQALGVEAAFRELLLARGAVLDETIGDAVHAHARARRAGARRPRARPRRSRRRAGAPRR